MTTQQQQAALRAASDSFGGHYMPEPGAFDWLLFDSVRKGSHFLCVGTMLDNVADKQARFHIFWGDHESVVHEHVAACRSDEHLHNMLSHVIADALASRHNRAITDVAAFIKQMHEQGKRVSFDTPHALIAAVGEEFFAKIAKAIESLNIYVDVMNSDDCDVHEEYAQDVALADAQNGTGYDAESDEDLMRYCIRATQQECAVATRLSFLRFLVCID